MSLINVIHIPQKTIISLEIVQISEYIAYCIKITIKKTYEVVCVSSCNDIVYRLIIV